MKMAIFVSLLITLTATSIFGQTPKLVGRGMLATETASRTRLGGDRFYVGDLMYVQVVCPPNIGEIYVSAHMEYQNRSGEWVPVPTKDTSLGEAYTSGRYPGLRDYVFLKEVSDSTQRQISFFMPYDAANLRSGTYARRYVIRLWNQDGEDIEQTVLKPEDVSVNNNSGKTTIKVVSCKACCPVARNSTGKALTPEPQVVKTGTIQFFDAESGSPVCMESPQ